MKKYKAVVVDDDPDVMQVLIEVLRFSDFEATGYDEAEKLLSQLNGGLLADMSPDLIVVDLKLKRGKMQGFDLIRELTEKDVPSEIMAISGAHPTADLEQSMRLGVAAIIPKPFLNLGELLAQMEILAHIGRKRRKHLDQQKSAVLN